MNFHQVSVDLINHLGSCLLIRDGVISSVTHSVFTLTRLHYRRRNMQSFTTSIKCEFFGKLETVINLVRS